MSPSQRLIYIYSLSLTASFSFLLDYSCQDTGMASFHQFSESPMFPVSCHFVPLCLFIGILLERVFCTYLPLVYFYFYCFYLLCPLPFLAWTHSSQTLVPTLPLTPLLSRSEGNCSDSSGGVFSVLILLSCLAFDTVVYFFLLGTLCSLGFSFSSGLSRCSFMVSVATDIGYFCYLSIFSCISVALPSMFTQKRMKIITHVYWILGVPLSVK